VLEQQLGSPLFERPGGRGQVQLTAIGQLSYQHAQRVLAATHAFSAEVTAALAGQRGTLRLGISQSTGYLIAAPLAALRRQSPRIEVSISNLNTAQAVVHQLVQGQLDIGLYINVEPDERVVTKTLFDDAWMIIARDDEPIVHGPGVSLDVLDGVDMIAWHQRWRAQANLEHAWRARGIKPRVIYRSDDNLMIQRLVAAGLGWACLGALSVQQLIDPRLRRVGIRDELPPRTLRLCYARQRELTPPALAFIEALQTVALPGASPRAGRPARIPDASDMEMDG
jgi:DNA-binding transcriptional LysR family regulator